MKIHVSQKILNTLPQNKNFLPKEGKLKKIYFEQCSSDSTFFKHPHFQWNPNFLNPQDKQKLVRKKLQGEI